MIPSCDRAWQAEALDDGRLGAEHRASFERHLASCTECRRERRSIGELRARAVGLAVSSPSALDRRRQRERLLAAANERLVSPKRSRAAAIFALAAALSAGALVAHRVHRERGSSFVARYRVIDVDRAVVRDIEHGVSLASGTARFHVEHVAGERFHVRLPDGEIEVRGTEFLVRVEQTTREVVVESGIVLLRVAGEEHLLTTGMRWSAAPASALAAPSVLAPDSACATDLSPKTAAPPALSAAPALHASAPASVASVHAPIASAAPASAAVATAGPAFARAMSAFEARDYANADAYFAEFASAHGGDARAEDAIFLRAVCASRTGDRAGARERADVYLAKYPLGFHAAEARKLSL